MSRVARMKVEVINLMRLTCGQLSQLLHAVRAEAAHVELALTLVAQDDGARAKLAARKVRLAAQRAATWDGIQVC